MSAGLAGEVGARPWLVLLLLVVVLGAAAAGALAFVRWASDHRRRMWRVAARAWDWLRRSWPLRPLEARFPWLARAFASLTRAEYLFVHLTLGLALSLGMIGFVVIADLMTGGRLAPIDLALADALHQAVSPGLAHVLKVFTLTGDGEILTIVAIVVAAGLLALRRRGLALGWIGAVAGAGLLNLALKGWFHRPRPSFEDAIVTPTGWSFPSGHAMGSLVTAGMLVYVAWNLTTSPARRWSAVAVAFLWTVVIGWSRLVLGAHYLSDVLAGFAAGTVWLASCVSGLEVARRRLKGAPSPAPIDGVVERE